MAIIARMTDALISPTNEKANPAEEEAGEGEGGRKVFCTESGRAIPRRARVTRICTVFYDITRLYVCTYVDNKKKKARKNRRLMRYE